MKPAGIGTGREAGLVDDASRRAGSFRDSGHGIAPRRSLLDQGRYLIGKNGGIQRRRRPAPETTSVISPSTSPAAQATSSDREPRITSSCTLVSSRQTAVGRSPHSRPRGRPKVSGSRRGTPKKTQGTRVGGEHAQPGGDVRRTSGEEPLEREGTGNKPTDRDRRGDRRRPWDGRTWIPRWAAAATRRWPGSLIAGCRHPRPAERRVRTPVSAAVPRAPRFVPLEQRHHAPPDRDLERLGEAPQPTSVLGRDGRGLCERRPQPVRRASWALPIGVATTIRVPYTPTWWHGAACRAGPDNGPGRGGAGLRATVPNTARSRSGPGQ